jgi:hypothetical protein
MVQKRQLEYIKPVEGPTAQIYWKMMNEMVQYAMNLPTTRCIPLCLQFEPYKIATVCVYLSRTFCYNGPIIQTWLDVLWSLWILSLLRRLACRS